MEVSYFWFNGLWSGAEERLPALGAEGVRCWAAHEAQAAESHQLCMGLCSSGSRLQINAVLSCTASLGLQNPVADTAQSVVLPPRPQGWARTDFISFSTFPSFVISVLSNLSRGFLQQSELGPPCQPELLKTPTERLSEG